MIWPAAAAAAGTVSGEIDALPDLQRYPSSSHNNALLDGIIKAKGEEQQERTTEREKFYIVTGAVHLLNDSAGDGMREAVGGRRRREKVF